MTTTEGTSERLIEIRGAALSTRERGRGRAIVLVQPGLLSSRAYEALAERLAERFRVITFDSRGHGRSTNPNGELSFEVLADDTAALIGALGLERPFVGGWSDGGEVALQVGLRHPGLARGLIAGGTSLLMGGSEAAQNETRVFFHADEHNMVDIDAFATEHASSLLPLLRRTHPHGEAQWQDVVHWSAKMWLTYGGLSREEAERIAAPTLVIFGDHDEFHPVEAGVGLYRRLPNAELAILPGSDHMRAVSEPTILTRPSSTSSIGTEARRHVRMPGYGLSLELEAEEQSRAEVADLAIPDGAVELGHLGDAEVAQGLRRRLDGILGGVLPGRAADANKFCDAVDAVVCHGIASLESWAPE